MTTINVDDQTAIDETNGTAWVEWGEGLPTIIWQERLRFHKDYARDLGYRLRNKNLPRKVERELRRLLGTDYGCVVSWGDKHKWLKFEVWPVANLDPTMEQDKAYTEILWPAITTMFNVTDPGTFNSPYLFTEIMREGPLNN